MNYFHFPNSILFSLLPLYNFSEPDQNGKYVIDCGSAKSLEGYLSFLVPDAADMRSEFSKYWYSSKGFYVHPYYNETYPSLKMLDQMRLFLDYILFIGTT